MDHLLTEARNPASMHLDELTPLELVRLMNAEDAKVIPAVAAEAEPIARAIEVTAERLRHGGRLVYIGAGTSGRLGVLDASECPPTFRTPPGLVVGLIAGGPAALTTAVEGAEDHPEHAERDLRAIDLSARDVLVGIATSGRTPYVVGALAYGRAVGAYTIGLACVPDSELRPHADLMITPLVGPEVLTGSTRLKAGTATKLVLNTLSTGTMVRLGKTYGNLMVDLRATNSKLRARANRIVRHFTGLTRAAAAALLEACAWEVKTALVVHFARVDPATARRRLDEAGGQVRAVIGEQWSTASVGTLASGGRQPPEGTQRPASGGRQPPEGTQRPASGGRRPPEGVQRLASGGRQPPASVDNQGQVSERGECVPPEGVDNQGQMSALGGLTPPARQVLVLGIDGGGTHTVALLAAVDPSEPVRWRVLGRGRSGPSNVQAVGLGAATRALAEAVERAFQDAGRLREPVAAACLGLAGAGRAEEQALVRGWAEAERLAGVVEVMGDAPLLLAAGTPGGWGIALVAGTGSMCWGQAPDGRTARAGGWGPLLGDEGSAYALVLSALRAITAAADGRAPATALSEQLLSAMGLPHTHALVAAVHGGAWDRARLAGLAALVLDTATRGDAVAAAILRTGARELAAAVRAVIAQLDLPRTGFPLALAGGLFCASAAYRQLVRDELGRCGLTPDPTALVEEPAEGAVHLAARRAAANA
jgi:N-acetylmuramic acid 6-phosphate etherase